MKKCDCNLLASLKRNRFIPHLFQGICISCNTILKWNSQCRDPTVNCFSEENIIVVKTHGSKNNVITDNVDANKGDDEIYNFNEFGMMMSYTKISIVKLDAKDVMSDKMVDLLQSKIFY